MDFSQPSQATQPATQPLSQCTDTPSGGLSDEEKANIVCILHSVTPDAQDAIECNTRLAPIHILPNDDLIGTNRATDSGPARYGYSNRQIALRLSSKLIDPKRGWVFGRFKSRCDLLLTERLGDRCLSSCHFRIFVNDHASLMIEDLSSNGTSLDDVPLSKEQPRTRVLKAGNVISVIADNHRPIKFLVTVPNRDSQEAAYAANLRAYLEANGLDPIYDSVRETNLGNNWDGGHMYNFTGKYGNGAFATVYKIQTKNTGDVYAAKELDTRRFLLDTRITQKLGTELAILKKLRHPNIVKYHHDIKYGQFIYIIMEAVTCGTLADRTDRYHRIPEEDVQVIGKHLLRALDYLHAGGITHRDLKPDNIMVSRDSPLVVKLADFGLSKLVQDATAAMSTFCGTTLYCAPEIFPDYNKYVSTAAKRPRNAPGSGKSAPYSSAVDMWSLGAVLFHVLAGVPPYVAKHDPEGAHMIEKVMKTDIDFDRLTSLDISDAAVSFLSRLLTKRPDKRPSKVECFAHPWIAEIREVIDYSDVVPLPAPRVLEAVEEENEDDAFTDDLIAGFQHLTQPSPEDPRTPKKPRTDVGGTSAPRQIQYPVCLSPAPSTASPRLFGEISGALRKSSGLFGQDVGANVIEFNHDADEDSTDEMCIKISVGGCARTRGTPTGSRKGKERARSEVGQPSAQIEPIPEEGTNENIPMEGAEAADVEQAPELQHVDLPASISNPAATLEKAVSIDSVTQLRLADVNLLQDDGAFDAQQKARQAAREQNARLKAQTFHAQPDTRISKLTPTTTIQDYKSFDDLVLANNRDLSGPGPSTQARQQQLTHRGSRPATGRNPPQVFGQLTPLAGSFSKDPILLKGRSTFWGRGSNCDLLYADATDTRVPKGAMKIVFHAPGIAAEEARGGNWQAVPNIYSVIATSASRGIRVNDKRLPATSSNGEVALYGKIYSGDIVTIFHSESTGESLRYKVEIFFGAGAEERPEAERPFQVEEERQHMARHRARMLDGSTHTELLEF